MADEDRPLEEPVDAIKRIDAALADLASTFIARTSRKPVGDLEATLLATPKDGTLFCQGQLISRATYAALWDWVQTNNRVQPGLFTVGDGSTTFGLPNFQGRFLVGAGALSPDTYAVGAIGGGSMKTLTTTELPSHTHTGTTANDTHDHGSAGSHGHSGSASSAGSHGGHFPAGSHLAASGPDLGLAAWNDGGSSDGNHSHSLSISSDGSHTHTGDTHNHTITMNNAGTGTPFDARPAFLAINWAVWV